MKTKKLKLTMCFFRGKRVCAIAEDFENWNSFDYCEEQKEQKIDAMLREPIVGS